GGKQRMKRSIVKRWILGGALGVLIAVGGVSGLALARHDSVGAGDNWPGHGGASDETAFSSLTQIDRSNVAQLGLAWSLDLPGEQMLEATPIAVDGVLYFTGSYA